MAAVVLINDGITSVNLNKPQIVYARRVMKFQIIIIMYLFSEDNIFGTCIHN